MANYYVDLPAAKVPANAMLDFSGLNSGLDTMREQNNQNAMRTYQQSRDKVTDQRANTQLGMEQQRLDLTKQQANDTRQQQLIEHVGGIAQMIDQDQDPASRQAKWGKFVGSSPLIAENLTKYGIDPNDHVNGPKFLVAEAQGTQPVQKPQFTQVGEDQLGAKQYGFVNANTQQVTPYQSKPAAGGGANSASVTGDDFLKTLDKPTGDQVRALAEGRMAFPAGFALKSPYWQNMIRAVSQYDPAFDAINYTSRSKTRNDFTSGKSADSIAALNTVIGHIGTLSDKGDAIGNTSYPMVNAATNAYRTATGDPRAKDFNTARKAVIDEVTRVWRGTGGSEGDIKTWGDQIDAANSPEQLHNVLGTIGDLLESRLDALKEKYVTGMGTTASGREFLTPGSQKALDRIRGRNPQAPDAANAAASQAAAPAQAAAPVRVNSPDEAMRLPPGTAFVTPDGRMKVRP